ncbi:MAG: DUF2220 family protein [Limnohabitans sp.]|nr:DUF2220 family protein [Limnohabitans sp.]
MKALLKTITESKKDKITLSDSFELQFRIIENQNDTGWQEKLDRVGSEGTGILVKAMINIRTFKGFLVNCYQPINATINNIPTLINPTEGTFTFIYDFETFIIPNNITIIGIENPENFRYINKQERLFKNVTPLFVSRYPQNKDLIKWIKNIPNNYLHFGDFDFEGINIFLNEYKKHIGDKAKFFIPDEIEKMIKEKGNSDNYNTQVYKEPHISKVNDESLIALIKTIHKHKKGLEQEYLINTNFDHIK